MLSSLDQCPIWSMYFTIKFTTSTALKFPSSRMALLNVERQTKNDTALTAVKMFSLHQADQHMSNLQCTNHHISLSQHSD